MIEFPIYFNEFEVPEAGIDTISIYIHPNLINKPSSFHEKGNANEAVSLRKISRKKRFSEETLCTNYIIDIQTEAIDPNANILDQVFGYIILLFKSKILSFCNYPDEVLIACLLEQNLHPLFILDFIDFYFDIKEEGAILLDKKDRRFPYGQCCDGCHIKTYNRIDRLKNRDNFNSQLLEQMQFPRRIEFNLTRNTCGFLHFANLDGDFNTVFYNYLNSLGNEWKKSQSSVIDIPNLKESEYHCLKQIDSVAFSPANQQIKYLENIPRERMPNKKARENEADNF